MSLNTLRIRQQQQQAKALQQPTRLPIATYESRDPIDGSRILKAGDGGVVFTDWIARSTPEEVPPLVAPSGTLGLPGYAGQK